MRVHPDTLVATFNPAREREPGNRTRPVQPTYNDEYDRLAAVRSRVIDHAPATAWGGNIWNHPTRSRKT